MFSCIGRCPDCGRQSKHKLRGSNLSQYHPSSDQARIALLLPWLGPLPGTLPLTLRSFKLNPLIDFFFFVDTPMPQIMEMNMEIPNNCRFIPFGQEDFNRLASQKLGKNVVIRSGYKLIDYKGVLGHIFEDYTKEYEFWGFGDIDILYGNLAHWLTPEVLSNYDVFSFIRSRPMIGPLTILRNNDSTTKLYKEIPDYERLLLHDKVEYICEWHHHKGHNFHDGLQKKVEEGSLRSWVVEKPSPYLVNHGCASWGGCTPELPKDTLLQWTDGKLMAHSTLPKGWDKPDMELAYYTWQFDKDKVESSYQSLRDQVDRSHGFQISPTDGITALLDPAMDGATP